MKTQHKTTPHLSQEQGGYPLSYIYDFSRMITATTNVVQI